MSKRPPPESIAWLTHAAAAGQADARLMLTMLERIEALEAAQREAAMDELRRICVDVAPCDSDTITRAATLLQQLAAPAPAVVPWSDEPTVVGRYLCLREGACTLHDVDFYQDPQMGITGQWQATEVCSGPRHGCPVAELQPAAWLLVSALPLPALQGGEVEA